MKQTPRQLRAQLGQQAQHCCGYCQTQEVVSGIPLTIEHIHPKTKGGNDEEENLWLACRLCNEAKGIQTEAIDPATGQITFLYNPRRQAWATHFAWSSDSTQIIGLTPIGRATIVALTLNDEFRCRARAIWVEAGWHPPR